MALALHFILATLPIIAVESFQIHEEHTSWEDDLVDNPQDGIAAKFGEFIQMHSRSYTPGSKEYSERLQLFAERVAEVDEHNSKGLAWRATVNALADRTAEELAQLRGYRHIAMDGSPDRGSMGLIGTDAHAARLTDMPAGWSWRGLLKAMEDVQDQSACGSCWAVTSATVLRAHSELYQKDRTFSIQQIIDCVPNLMSCGGTGGCKGATAELAMDYVAKVGLVTSDVRQYLAQDGDCPAEMKAPKPSLRSALKQAISLPDVTVAAGGGASFGMLGWRKLPVNMAQPLIMAVYSVGPVAVSVAASGAWNSYASGVMSACDPDAVINHAVTLVGYGEQPFDGLLYKYWQIQNSWGRGWGEGGFGRLLRLDHSNESSYCGWDTSPGDGTGCKGGPSKVWVCGNCGILYDSVIPKFVVSSDGWIYQNRH